MRTFQHKIRNITNEIYTMYINFNINHCFWIETCIVFVKSATNMFQNSFIILRIISHNQHSEIFVYFNSSFEFINLTKLQSTNILCYNFSNLNKFTLHPFPVYSVLFICVLIIYNLNHILLYSQVTPLSIVY